jgi:hypothetical protein
VKAEKWLPVVGMEGFFEVSDAGRIRTVEREVRFVSKKGNEAWRTKKPHIMHTQLINSGYDLVHLSIDEVRKARTVHTVVAEAFIGPRPKGMDVCHNNSDKQDNRAVNLRYDTRKGNFSDKLANGTIYGCNRNFKLNPSIANFIRFVDDGTPEFARRAAFAFGVKVQTIRRIRTKVLWKYA